MTRIPRLPLLKHAILATLFSVHASCFAAATSSHSQPAAGAKVESVVVQPISVECKQRIANEKVLLLFAERFTNGMNANQSRYEAHSTEIERRLLQNGVTVLNREDIKKKMIQPEIDVHFVVDPSKAQRLVPKQGATLTLRGLITARKAFSPLRKITETYVSVNLSLIDANGYYISDAILNSESRLGADTLGMALELIQQRGEDAVLKILSGYCVPNKQEQKQ